MKKRHFIGLSLALVSLVSCDKLPLNTKTYTSETSITSDDESTIVNENSTSNSTNTTSIVSSTSEVTTTIETPTTSFEETSTTTKTSTTTDEVVSLTDKSYSSGSLNDGTYSTGNYGSNNKLNIGYYRTDATSGNFVKILKTPSHSIEAHPSCIYNTSAFKGIREFEITYMSNSDFYILASNDKSYCDRYEVLKSGSYTTINLRISPSAYYKICAGSSDLTITSLTVKYDNKTSYSTSTLTYSDSRINVSDFYSSYNIEPGCERSIPDSITINNDGTYTVNSYKTYTYATIDYAKNNGGDKFAYTDPVDVANYYMLFHTWPANYVYKGDISNAKKAFSSKKVRQVSSYSRTSGYATAVPYYHADGFVYYELDLDLDGIYSTSSRGVYRLVVWDYGFDKTGYDKNPVVVFTDDHYATFSEYLNYGSFGTRFNSEQQLTAYKWCQTKTLSK